MQGDIVWCDKCVLREAEYTDKDDIPFCRVCAEAKEITFKVSQYDDLCSCGWPGWATDEKGNVWCEKCANSPYFDNGFTHQIEKTVYPNPSDWTYKPDGYSDKQLQKWEDKFLEGIKGFFKR